MTTNSMGLEQTLSDEVAAAVATLNHLGYTWQGGKQWKPPVGLPPSYINDDRAELEAYRKDSSEPVAYMTYKGYLLHAADPKVAEYSEPTPLYEAPPIHAVTVPDGWQLVPTELTSVMRNAWDSVPNGDDDNLNMQNAYRAMIAAAPSIINEP